MYHRYFQLAEEPFGVTADARFFFASPQHAQAVASLYYAVVQRRGFATLIAAPGLGKTSVVVSLLPRLRERAEVVFLVHPTIDAAALLESVLHGLGISPDAEPARRSQQLADCLMDLDRRGRNCVIILDEAQNLSFEALESVRMLSNYERPDRKLIQFILVGQPALASLLMRPECEQVRQRINIVTRLHPLSSEHVSAYIEARVRRAGGGANLFTSDALRAIAGMTGGVPRNINTLCFNALRVAFADSSKVITKTHVSNALKDLRLDVPERASTDPKLLAFAASVGESALWNKATEAAARNWRSVTRALRLQPQDEYQ